MSNGMTHILLIACVWLLPPCWQSWLRICRMGLGRMEEWETWPRTWFTKNHSFKNSYETMPRNLRLSREVGKTNNFIITDNLSVSKQIKLKSDSGHKLWDVLRHNEQRALMNLRVNSDGFCCSEDNGKGGFSGARNIEFKESCRVLNFILTSLANVFMSVDHTLTSSQIVVCTIELHAIAIWPSIRCKHASNMPEKLVKKKG